ncbi:hypothetical protein [Sporosarcina psychrophila]|uniref:hypothetical protein n=1 Tax=Sporosarcina psychrophila TaxID=1476 RepID=UPI00078BF375|nr:hypothetical protein [Sporosarcina psychrophila]AMQ06763.1 hypothetical protein AZE41_12920 [Sporosarcina psychrophila]
MNNIEWHWQQENAKLQQENAELRKKFAIYRARKVLKERATDGKIFTKKQLKFIKDNELDYRKVYRLTHKLNSVGEALVRALEETI